MRIARQRRSAATGISRMRPLDIIIKRGIAHASLRSAYSACGIATKQRHRKRGGAGNVKAASTYGSRVGDGETSTSGGAVATGVNVAASKAYQCQKMASTAQWQRRRNSMAALSASIA